MTEELIAKMAFQLQTCDAPVSDDDNTAASVNDGNIYEVPKARGWSVALLSCNTILVATILVLEVMRISIHEMELP